MSVTINHYVAYGLSIGTDLGDGVTLNDLERRNSPQFAVFHGM